MTTKKHDNKATPYHGPHDTEKYDNRATPLQEQHNNRNAPSTAKRNRMDMQSAKLCNYKNAQSLGVTPLHEFATAG